MKVLKVIFLEVDIFISYYEFKSFIFLSILYIKHHYLSKKYFLI